MGKGVGIEWPAQGGNASFNPAKPESVGPETRDSRIDSPPSLGLDGVPHLFLMSIVVHQMAHSPYCIPITQLLKAAGIAHETREVPNWDRGEIIRLTDGEFYQVPLLVHDDRVVFESGGSSQDIARYCDTVFTAGLLFPARLEGPHQCVLEFLEDKVEECSFRLADIHYVPAIEDIVERTMVVRHKERKFGRDCVDRWQREAPAIRAELDGLLARFEKTLTAEPYLFGAAPVYADFLLFGILGNLTYRDWNQLSPDQHCLAAFQRRMADYRFPVR